MLATLAGCAGGSPSEQRPDPTGVVSQYLEAIASGDAATARLLDDAVVEEENANDPDADLDTLRTDAVLGPAQRISDVEVDPDTVSDASGDEGDRLVKYRFEVGGESVESTLSVTWNADSGEWELTQSLAHRLWVTADVSRIEGMYVGFEVPGATVPQPTVQEEATPYFLAYPGVYSVTAEIDPALLVDPASGTTREAVVGTEFETVLTYAVTALS